MVEAERASAAKGRAAREHRQVEAELYEKMAAEALQAVGLVVVEEERALAQWKAESPPTPTSPRPPRAHRWRHCRGEAHRQRCTGHREWRHAALSCQLA